MSDGPIYNYLDISTAHVTEREMDLIRLAPGRVIEHEYGAWVWVVPDEEDYADEWIEAGVNHANESFPNVRAVMDYARSKNCTWINLDADAGTIPDLPTHEW